MVKGKKDKPTMRLYWQQARRAGIECGEYRAGWIRLARAICGVRVESKSEAKRILREKFATLGGGKVVASKGCNNDAKAIDVSGNDFLRSYEWRRLRMYVLKRDGARCACCGVTPQHGARMNVDHIKPRRFFPSLALDPTNLQVLCEECNHGKGNWDQTDWRKAIVPHGTLQ